MSKTYVPITISEYLGESKSITLKRKYGERAPVTAGVLAPLRNQVLSFVAENASVSKIDLKRYILGLKEGGSTSAAANMFIKRNAKYFVTESKGGVTYFRLSQLGERLVNKFSKPSSVISESKMKDELHRRFKKLNESPEDLPIDDEGMVTADIEFEDDRFNDEIEPDSEIDDVEPEGEENIETDTDDLDVDEDNESDDNFDYFEDDEKIVLTYYKNSEDGEKVSDEDELSDKDLEDDEDLGNEEELIDRDLENGEDDEDELQESDDDFDSESAGRPHDEAREFDFKDKGRPGLYDMDESVKVKESKEPKTKLEQIIENIKAARKSDKLNEAVPEPAANDELTDKDLGDVGGDKVPDDDEIDDIKTQDQEVEKVEITEFIITVDNVDSAIDELKELGVNAERVPVEPKEEEVPIDLPDEQEKDPIKDKFPVDNIPDKPQVEKPPVKESVNETDEDLGTNDELSLGDQGKKTDELDLDASNDIVEPTTEFEENKLKVKAEDWPILKTWLENKGVDVTEMFGGEIEMEEISDVEDAETQDTGPVSDDDVDFSEVSDKDVK